jgi:hypothetical protein
VRLNTTGEGQRECSRSGWHGGPTNSLCAGLDVELVRLLLVAGADPDANDDDGDSPRALVSEEGIPAMLELFGGYERRGNS